MIVLENVFSITEQVHMHAVCYFFARHPYPHHPPPPALNTMSNLTNLVTTLRLARTQHCKNVVTGKTYNSGALSWLVTYCLLHFR